MRRTLLFFGLWLAVSTRVAGAAELAPSWVELAATGQLSVRAVVVAGAPCPAVSADGAGLAVQRRGAPDGNSPIEVCEALAPADSTRLTVGGTVLPVVPAQVKRIVVFGDTRCRLEGRAVSDCSNPT